MKFTTWTSAQLQESCLRVGRISFTDAGLLMDWSACGVTLCVSAVRIVFEFAAYHSDQPVYVAVFVDGKKTVYGLADSVQRIVVPLGETLGVHTVTLLRLSEGADPLFCTAVHLVSPAGVGEPALLPPIAPASRRIVFFGDSITCGFGSVGTVTSPFLTAEEDPTEAYAWRAAALLGADAELVSISGQGIVRNCNGDVDTPIPQFFSWQSRSARTPHDFSQQADIVVVNAGTNDFSGGVTEEEFARGARAFLRDLRLHYPRAALVWFYGLMGLPYDGVLRALEEELANTAEAFTYVPITPIYEMQDEVAALGHPSKEGDIRGAACLAAALYPLLQ